MRGHRWASQGPRTLLCLDGAGGFDELRERRWAVAVVSVGFVPLTGIGGEVSEFLAVCARLSFGWAVGIAGEMTGSPTVVAFCSGVCVAGWRPAFRCLFRNGIRCGRARGGGLHSS